MIKRLGKNVGEYKKQTILTPIFVTLEVIFDVLIPFIMSKLLAVIESGEGNINKILGYGGLLVIFALVALYFGAMSGRMAAISSAGFAKNLRKNMFYSLQDYSFNNIDKFSSSSLITRMTTDVNWVQMAFQMIIRIAVRAPLNLVFTLIMSFMINAKLALVFLATVPLLAVGLFIIMRLAFPVFDKVFKNYDGLNVVVQENIRGMRVVKTYVREEEETQKFKDASGKIYKDFVKASRIVAFNNPLMNLAVYASTVLICWFGTKAVIADIGVVNGFTASELSTLITYVTQVLMSLMMLSMIFVQITIAEAPAKRICEVLDEKSDIHTPENAVNEVIDGSIEFVGVDFSYKSKKDKLCLSGVNLAINSGETVGIIGGTGSSKTTLIQLIPRLYDATEGEVKFGGVNVKDYDLKVLRDSVSVVLQKNVLFSGTIKENLRWGNENATDEELVHACKLAQAHDFVESFPDGYDTVIDQGGVNVSGGQKQRLCIARALLKKPKILILDDSTSAVDTRTDALIRKAFKEEIPNTTKIIIAQRIASVQEADKIIVMDGGKVVGFGNHDELLATNEIYQEVYYSQNKGGSENE
ncbi:MAG: ABC transporter ATP-binding protein [Clostridia bacterium]|nr:ABC transporter ATP-binding protein [Clostridia bacterium]